MQTTTNYNLKKPDYTDFADIQDINDNMDTIDEELAAPTGDLRDGTVSFTDADLDSGITSFPTFLAKIVSGMKLAKFIRDFKAGMAYVLHKGNLINNALTTTAGVNALDAAMGKTLQDEIDSLNSSFLTAKFINIVISDSVNGFYDTGIPSAEYVILGYYATFSNVAVRISNLYSGGRAYNYRIQLIEAVTGNVVRSASGDYSVYLVYAKRSLFGF